MSVRISKQNLLAQLDFEFVTGLVTATMLKVPNFDYLGRGVVNCNKLKHICL